MNYTKAFLGGYLRTFYINWIFKKNSKATDTQAQAFCCITQRLPWVASYLHVNWIVNNCQMPQTSKQRYIGGLPRGLCGWLPTYILYKLDL